MHLKNMKIGKVSKIVRKVLNEVNATIKKRVDHNFSILFKIQD